MARSLTQVVLVLGSGLVGALALTAVHQGLRHSAPPRRRSKVLKAETVGLYLLGGLAAAGVAWFVSTVGGAGALERAKRAAEEARLGVNQRNSGMIH
jgi:hypothetical protein